MTRKERLHRCYFGLETDRPAVYSRTGFPPDDPTYDALKVYLKEHTELKKGFDASSLCEKNPTSVTREPHSPEYDSVITTLRTPAGDLRSVYLDGRGGRPGMTREYYIKDGADCEKYLSLPMPKINNDCRRFFEEREKIGESGIVEVMLGSNPGGFAAELMGSETFAVLSITARELVYALCERRMQILLKMMNVLTNAGVGPYFSMLSEEYIVPPLHGKKDFYDFNVKYDRQITDAIHNAGGRVHIHCHGPLKGLLPAFIDLGADVLHPVEPPPLGDVTAKEARAVLGGKICIEGNIQIANMYDDTPEQIREETKALIRDAYVDNKGLIVCPTASPYIPGAGADCFENYRAMIDTVVGRA